MENFLVELRRYLSESRKRLPFRTYKFTGDGWIFLFQPNVTGEELLEFLTTTSAYTKETLNRMIIRYLDIKPVQTGANFGIEKGRLRRLALGGRDEYIGRALNVACRLQRAIKEGEDRPAYTALITNSAFNEYVRSQVEVTAKRVQRTLPNISGGGLFNCRLLRLLD